MVLIGQITKKSPKISGQTAITALIGPQFGGKLGKFSGLLLVGCDICGKLVTFGPSHAAVAETKIKINFPRRTVCPQNSKLPWYSLLLPLLHVHNKKSQLQLFWKLSQSQQAPSSNSAFRGNAVKTVPSRQRGFYRAARFFGGLSFDQKGATC